MLKKIDEIFFILYKNWVMIIIFLFEIVLNFLIKTCLFSHFKNASTLIMVVNIVYA